MIALCLALMSGAPDADLELFERRIRPILVERCYRCHNSVDSRKARLALDHREGLLEGGRSGPAIVPGDPEASLLMRSVRHLPGPSPMPRDEPRLEPDELADFAEWIRRGAPDPRDRAPSGDELDREMSWEAMRDRRASWWSFQPLSEAAPPEVRDLAWPRDPLDRWVLAGLEREGVTPSPEAAPRDLLRRLHLVLTGLPPAPEDVQRFLADPGPGAYPAEVDRLLASPAFAEHWARHWMDLVRFAESHGSEGDPNIPGASVYRDALIRAFDADLPLDRLVREHLAGDRMSPRVDPGTGIDDAAVMTAHLRFVQHGYGPTDPLAEQLRFTDNQIDVISKSFLGLTVSCAQCHDHKFDPISQRDYYALYGVLASQRPGTLNVDGPERRSRHAATLSALKAEIHEALASAYHDAADRLASRLEALPPELSAAEAPLILRPWLSLRGLDGEARAAAWASLQSQQADSRRREARRAADGWAWTPAESGTLGWHAHGNTMRDRPRPAGSFHVLPEGDRLLDGVHPAGFFSHELSTRHSGVLTSSSFAVEHGELWIRAAGSAARARYSMQHYPRVAGPPYKSHGLNSAAPRWLRWDMSYWAGDDAYLELATARDIPVEAGGEERSWWALYEVVAREAGQPAPQDEIAELLGPLLRPGEPVPADQDELAARYARVLREAALQWREGRLDDAGARWLDASIQAGLLPADRAGLPGLGPLVDRYRGVEAEVPVPHRAPGALVGDRVDQPLYPRGDHTRPAPPVPQRFLEVLDPRPYDAAVDGRLQLADDLFRPDNPLTARVLANRLWHWTFGQGLVRTPDNLGRLGQPPTHPELLDRLARDLRADGWSLRRMLRRLVTSATFRQSSDHRPELADRDPDGRWLARAHRRRLPAESIRDSLLAVSGRLDPTRMGGSVDERSPRRSVYLRIQRNRLPPFLATFDAPPPFTTTGARETTHVPAQSLALLNDPLVLDCADVWARRILGDTRLGDDAARVDRMFLEGLSRPPAPDEREAALRLVGVLQEEQAARAGRRLALESSLAESRTGMAALLDRGRERVRAARGGERAASSGSLPEPIARWDFEDGLSDSIGAMHGEALGAVRVERGRLILDGAGSVLTRPADRPLAEKTLEAWVLLGDLDQRGPGVLTVQDLAGERFDSLVYAEREARRWIAGSDFFRRTQDVGGTAEERSELIHVAVSYAADGTIQLYREGRPDGRPYRTGVQSFAAGDWAVLLGMRHGGLQRTTARLRGEIERAQLYDRALDPEEIAATALGDPDFVPRREALAALTPDEDARWQRLEARRAADEATLATLPDEGPASDPLPAWRGLAQSLFCTKEFLDLP